MFSGLREPFSKEFRIVNEPGIPHDNFSETPKASGPGRNVPVSVQFNLERDPLQTGEKEPEVSWATRFRLWPSGWAMHEFSFGMLAVWLIILTIVGAVILEFFADKFVSRYVRQMWELM